MFRTILPDQSIDGADFPVPAFPVEGLPLFIERRYAEIEVRGLFRGHLLGEGEELPADAHAAHSGRYADGAEVAAAGEDRLGRKDHEARHGAGDDRDECLLLPDERSEVNALTQGLPRFGHRHDVGAGRYVAPGHGDDLDREFFHINLVGRGFSQMNADNHPAIEKSWRVQ